MLGIDPGTTLSFSLLDLHGRSILIRSGKEISLSNMLSSCIQAAHPVIIGTDKHKVPYFVRLSARKLGCRVIAPARDLQKHEKKLLLISAKNHLHRRHEETLKNDHERDSLSCAIYAYRKICPQLKKINNYIRLNSSRISTHIEKERFIRSAITSSLNFDDLLHIIKRDSANTSSVKATSSSLSRNTAAQLGSVAMADHSPHTFSTSSKNNISAPGIDELLILYPRYDDLAFEIDRLKHAHSQLLISNRNLRRESRKAHHRLQTAQQKLDQNIQRHLSGKNTTISILAGRHRRQLSLIDELSAATKHLEQFIRETPRNLLLIKIKNLSKSTINKMVAHQQIRTNDYLLVENPSIFSSLSLTALSEMHISLLSLHRFPDAISLVLPTTSIGRGDVISEVSGFALISPHTLRSRNSLWDLASRVVSDYQHQRGL